MKLKEEQNLDGSFSLKEGKGSIFATSLFLLLDKANSSKKEKALKWLKKQKNKKWLFHENLGINFLALTAIFKNDPDFINGKALGKILTLLTFLEKEEGGPYYSKRSQEPIVDLGENVAIAYFLSLQEIELPNLNSLIEKSIREKDFSSQTFKDKYLVIYLISTFYKGKFKKDLALYLNKQQNLNKVDLNLVKESLKNLGRKAFSKNEEVLRLDREEKIIFKKILEVAEKRFSKLPEVMKKLAKSELEKTLMEDPDKQMFLIALYVRQALGINGEFFSDELIAELGLANTFYWTAFIIYDDFWDEDDAANPQILPTANLYARHYSNFFSNLLPEEIGFRNWFHELMDNLDAANTWENVACRTKVENNIFQIPEKIPDYGNYDLKYQPASGQVLGPVAMFCLLRENLDSPEIINLINYFKHYLIAMQINDDSHDWKEDMQRGHLSTVVVMMIEDWLEKYPDSKQIDLKKDESKLEKIYWYKTIKRACKIALENTSKSRDALNQITLIENLDPLEKMIKLNEQVARDALEEQKKSTDFIKEFN